MQIENLFHTQYKYKIYILFKSSFCSQGVAGDPAVVYNCVPGVFRSQKNKYVF